MDQASSVSQLTLIKAFSQSQNYTVHTHVMRKAFSFDVQVDESSTVESLILETLERLKLALPSFSPPAHNYTTELYAARRTGRKISDLPSFEGQQKILKTGQKCFYLLIQSGEVALQGKTSTVSTKSIRTEMKPLEIKGQEYPITKERGCFCFS